MERYKLGKTKISVPSGWHEISYERGLKIFEGEMNEVEALALLADKKPKEIRKATDIETIYYFTNTFRFIKQLPAPAFPKSVQLGGDKIRLPFVDNYDLGDAEIGQVEDMQNIITKMNKEFIGEEERELTELELIKIMPHIAAVFLQKYLDGEYDWSKAEALVPRVKKEANFKAVVGMGYFFLSRLTDLSTGSPKGWQSRRSIKKRLRRVFKKLTWHLGFTPRLT